MQNEKAAYARRSALSEGEVHELRRRIAQLEAERDTPETRNFMRGVPLEAAHQRGRWGAEHDAGKAPLDWFWLIGYLAQKAATAAMAGDTDKAKHHTISTAAALANWHAALAGEDNRMRPGIDVQAVHESAVGNADASNSGRDDSHAG